MTTKREILDRHDSIRTDIELGLCTVACAGALKADSACRCRCRGDNHGKLWADREEPARAAQDAMVGRRVGHMRVINGGRAS